MKKFPSTLNYDLTVAEIRPPKSRKPHQQSFVGAVWGSLRYTPGDGLSTLLIRVFDTTPKPENVKTAFGFGEQCLVANESDVARIIREAKFKLFHFKLTETGYKAIPFECDKDLPSFRLSEMANPDPEELFDKQHGLTWEQFRKVNRLTAKEEEV